MPILSVADQTGNGLEKFLMKMRKEDGTFEPIVNLGAYFDGSAYVGVSDVELLRELLTKPEIFRKHPLVYDALKFILGNGLVTSEGELWKRQRKLLTPLFHFQQLKQMIPIMVSRCEEFIKKMKEGKHDCEERSIYAPSEFSDLTLRVVISSVFGGDFDADQMSELWHRVLELRINYTLGKIFFPDIWDWLPIPWSYKPRRLLHEIAMFVKSAIDRKKILLSQQEDQQQTQKDLLSAMLSVVDEETGKLIEERLIIDESLTFLFAGHDTTSNLVSWCLYLLALHKEAQETLQQEVDEVLSNGVPSEENLKKLVYCRQVLQETLRFRPPVPGFFDRQLTQDFTYKDILFPKGSTITGLTFPNHLSTTYWEDPLTFNPSRFSESEQQGNKIHPFVFLPFSAGARNCIGSKFAVQEAVVIISMLMKEFNVHVNPNTPVDMCFVGTVTPVGLRVWFTPR